ncbi:MAG: histidine phosphatase family protein, partial [Anaerolineaceae bacterium]
MTELWLVRHGETIWNQEGRLQGSIDIELNEGGVEQARRLAEQLKDTEFQSIYSSPLKRAHKTAEMIAACAGQTVQVDPRLVEVRMGEWEGMRSVDIRRQYPELVAIRDADPVYAPVPGGETVQQLAVRVNQAADEISKRHPRGPVLIVSHGLSIAVLICLVREIP